MLEFSLILLMSVAKFVSCAILFATGAYLGGFLFRKGWDDAGTGKTAQATGAFRATKEVVEARAEQVPAHEGGWDERTEGSASLL